MFADFPLNSSSFGVVPMVGVFNARNFRLEAAGPTGRAIFQPSRDLHSEFSVAQRESSKMARLRVDRSSGSLGKDGKKS